MINLHYIGLTIIILLGSLLRFWHLDLKPLWLDEILTAFFGFGQNYNDLPLDILFPIAQVDNIFAFKPGVSCGEIAHNLIIHSTHPPLFFCLIHSWINLIGTYPLAWALRSLPALIGVIEIAAIYSLNRLVFSKSAALMAAALMAVSPFAVYLSQEARHYTLPMLLTTLALLGLIKIQQSLYINRQQPKLFLLLFWGIVNSIGCYIHYFFLLVFIAQILTLIGLAYWYRRKTSPPAPLLQGEGSHTPPTSPPAPLLQGEGSHTPSTPTSPPAPLLQGEGSYTLSTPTSPPTPLLQGEGSYTPSTPLRQGEGSHTPPFPCREGGLGGLGLLVTILVILGVVLSYLPWVSVLLQTVGREETDWLPTPQNITPLFQLLVGWILMVIALPVEEQPLWIAIPMGLLMVGFGSWFGWRLWLGFQKLWRRKDGESGDNLGKFDRNNLQATSSPSIQLATATLSYFTLGVMLQFLGIIYLLGKDISIVPRYNFVYYPAVCALLGASLTLGNRGGMGGLKLSKTRHKSKKIEKLTIILPLTVSLLSTIFVIYNLVFLKPFYPDLVARNMTQEPRVPMMMVVGYNNLQDVALGLSFALALNRLNSDINLNNPNRSIVFLNNKYGYNTVWQKLADLPVSPVNRLHLWIFAPGLRRRDYLPQLTIANQKLCSLDSAQSYRLEISHRLYRCH